MKFKIAIILIFYSLALVWDGCSITDPCECPQINFEFIDYKGFDIAVNNTEIDTIVSRSFEILLTADSVHFIAQCNPNGLGLGLLTPAYGCSCLPEGFRGDKFPILAIDIFANHPYKEELIAESNLNHIFEINAIDEFGNQTIQTINEVNRFPLINETGGQLFIRTEEAPDSTGMDIPYTFEVVITKSNGEILRMMTDEVRWL